MTFDEYCKNIDPFKHGTNNVSYFNDFEFGASSRAIRRKLGKPLYVKKQDSARIWLIKRKVAGFKFVFKLYFIDNSLVHFESECRNVSKILQKALLETVIKKYNCDLDTFSFNHNCAVKVSNLMNVRVQFFSTNRKHIEMMKVMNYKKSADHSINKIFNLSDVVIDQYI